MTSTVVLAAGHGSRIRAVSGDLPKPLLSIEGRSVIERNLGWLARYGVGSVLINLHYEGDRIRAALGDGRHLGVEITYVPEEQLLGTAGTVRHLASRLEAPILVVYGDSLLDFDLHAMRAAHARSGAVATISLFDRQRHPHSGIAGDTASLASDGRVEQFREGAADARYVNAGVYLVEAAAFDAAPPEASRDFSRELFPALLRSGAHLQGFVFDEGYCLGLDTPQSLDAARTLVARGRVTLR